MTPDEAKTIISAAGGDTNFARLLGIDTEAGFAQRVNNWKRRGIPSDVVLAHLDVIRRLQATPRKRGSKTSEARA